MVGVPQVVLSVNAKERKLLLAMQRRTAALTPELRMAWGEAVQALRKTMSDATIEALITSGRINDILTPERLDAALASMRRGVLSGLQSGASTVINSLPSSAAITFTTRANPRILDAIRTLDSNLLRPLKAELRETVRLAVEQGLRDGKNAKVISRTLRDTIGLAPNQWQQVDNYRAKLELGLSTKGNTLRDKRYDKIIADGRMTPKLIDKAVERYAARRVAEHANTIAKTAALNANRMGADAAFRSSLDAGLIDPARAYKVWVTVGDSKVREEHAAMEGERVRWDEPFSNGEMVPSDYNCRCILAYEMDPLPANG